MKYPRLRSRPARRGADTGRARALAADRSAIRVDVDGVGGLAVRTINFFYFLPRRLAGSAVHRNGASLSNEPHQLRSERALVLRRPSPLRLSCTSGASSRGLSRETTHASSYRRALPHCGELHTLRQCRLAMGGE